MAAATRRVIAMISGKGGSGKSVITCSLGAALAHMGLRTLIVDMDLFTFGLSTYALQTRAEGRGITTSAIFKKRRSEIADSDEMLNLDCEELKSEFEASFIDRKYTKGKLFFLPSAFPNHDLASELTLSRAYANLSRIVRTLQLLIANIARRECFDLVLIDTRGGADSTNVAAALAADGYVLVTEEDPTSTKSASLLLKEIDNQKDAIRSGAVPADTNSIFLGFVINKCLSRSEETHRHLRDEFKGQHLASFFHEDEVMKCYRQGTVPIVQHPNCDFKRSLAGLAGSLTKSAGLGEEMSGAVEDFSRPRSVPWQVFSPSQGWILLAILTSMLLTVVLAIDLNQEHPAEKIFYFAVAIVILASLAAHVFVTRVLRQSFMRQPIKFGVLLGALPSVLKRLWPSP